MDENNTWNTNTENTDGNSNPTDENPNPADEKLTATDTNIYTSTNVNPAPDYRNQQPVQKKEKKPKSFGKGVLTGVLCTALVFCLGLGIVYAVYSKNTSLLSSRVQNKISMIAQVLNQYYYQDIDVEDEIEGMYKGLVNGLGDPYTTYYTADEYADFQISTTGDYAGIGATLQKDTDTGYVKVVNVYADSPAEQAGLQKGDLITAADGKDASEYELDEFVEFIRGEEGTTVEIVYYRDSEKHTVEITRAQIDAPSVTYQMLDDKVGYINVTSFDSDTEEEYQTAMSDLTSQGMQAVIFDMRSNGGGLVDSATAMLDDILPEGITVYMKDKNGNETDYTSDAENYIDMPIVVLTSEYTASAAEIFTGAIRDFDYGTIIGTTTYGKGVVQVTVPLSDGSAIKVTTETYYTPSGDEIQGKGIEPDIELEYEFLGDEDDTYDVTLDNQIQYAVEYLENGI